MISYVRDRFLNLRLKRDEKEIKIGFLVTGSISAFLLANIIYLNLLIISNNSTPPKIAASVVSTPVPTAPSSTGAASPIPQPGQTAATQALPKSIAKDYYVNLGSGTNQSTDWADVPGTLNTVDLGLYQNIKEIHLETTINVPTANGTVSVRLFNKTDNYAVLNSDRTVQSQVNGDLLISQPLIYDVGPKFYQVEMKSQLGVPSTLLQARIHITTQ